MNNMAVLRAVALVVELQLTPSLHLLVIPKPGTLDCANIKNNKYFLPLLKHQRGW